MSTVASFITSHVPEVTGTPAPRVDKLARWFVALENAETPERAAAIQREIDKIMGVNTQAVPASSEG